METNGRKVFIILSFILATLMIFQLLGGANLFFHLLKNKTILFIKKKVPLEYYLWSRFKKNKKKVAFLHFTFLWFIIIFLPKRIDSYLGIDIQKSKIYVTISTEMFFSCISKKRRKILMNVEHQKPIPKIYFFQNQRQNSFVKIFFALILDYS